MLVEGSSRQRSPSATGGWLDPSNVIHRIKEAFTGCGYGWVTGHVFRKTVATVWDEAGLPTGRWPISWAKRGTWPRSTTPPRRETNPAAAGALEAMADSGS